MLLYFYWPLGFALHYIASLNNKRLYEVSTKKTVARPHPHFCVKASDFDIDLLSFLQLENASSKSSVLLSGRHILVNHQEKAIVGKKTHAVVWLLVEVHLHINIVATIKGDLKSSIGILKAI